MNLDEMLKKSYGKKVTPPAADKKVVQPVVWGTLQPESPPSPEETSAVPLSFVPLSESAAPTLSKTAPTLSKQTSPSSAASALSKQTSPSGSSTLSKPAASTLSKITPPDVQPPRNTGGFLKTGTPQPQTANQKPVEKGGGTFTKTAKFLMLIGVEEAAKILEKLPPDQVEKIALELAYMRDIPPDEAAAILEEFSELAQRAQYTPSGGVETARSILDRAFGTEQGEKLLRKAVPDVDGKPFDFITELDGEKLSFLLHGESAAVQAIVLSKIPPALAARYINAMEPQLRTDIVLRLGRMQKVERGIVQRIDRVMREKSAGFAAGRSEKFDGRAVLARILNTAGYDKSCSIIDSLKNTDSGLAADIEHRMFGVDRIPGCFGRGLQELVAGMSDRDLALLIHGKTPEFRAAIFDNLSENRRKDVLALLGIMIERNDTFEQSGDITGKFLQKVRRGFSDGTIFDQNSKIIRA